MSTKEEHKVYQEKINGNTHAIGFQLFPIYQEIYEE